VAGGEVNHSPPSSAGLRMGGVIPVLPLVCLHSVDRKYFYNIKFHISNQKFLACYMKRHTKQAYSVCTRIIRIKPEAKTEDPNTLCNVLMTLLNFSRMSGILFTPTSRRSLTTCSKVWNTTYHHLIYKFKTVLLLDYFKKAYD
jgi:hypothetical protein